MRCWKGGCRSDCIGTLEAQWTLVDYLSFVTCAAHSLDGLLLLESKLIDGQPPMDAWLQPFLDPVPWSGGS